jgi:adenylate kinase family enzyme
VTTLGQAVAERVSYNHFDTDDYYWLPTIPPYREKRDIAERLSLLSRDLDEAHAWVLSGSLMEWGDPLIPRFDLVVFLHVPTEIRLARLAARERQRFGAAIDPGGGMHTQHNDFLEWAAGYETGAKGGRSLDGHRSWLAKLPCPVLRLSGAAPVDVLVEQTLYDALKSK